MLIPQIVYKSSGTATGNGNICGNINLSNGNINSNNINNIKTGSTQTIGKNTYLLYLIFFIV
jgi:hypothetical protein